MKLSRKLTFVTLATVVALGGVLWLRDLASWRPVKIGEIPQGSFPHFMSGDGKTILLDGTKHPTILDVATGRQRRWPVSASFLYYSRSLPNPLILFSPHPPNRMFVLENAERKVLMCDLSTGLWKRTFQLPQRRYDSGRRAIHTLVMGNNSNHVGVVEMDTSYEHPSYQCVFYQWDIATGKLVHEMCFYPAPLDSLGRNSSRYTVSQDGKQLVRSDNDAGYIWDTSSGKCLRSWKSDSYGKSGFASSLYQNPAFFSDDAHIVAYNYMSMMHGWACYAFVDTATGAVKWTTRVSPLYHRTGDELVWLRAKGCTTLDINTGLFKRHLPGPSSWQYNPFGPPTGDQILRATSDYIYTFNDKREILRWRAR